MKTTVGKFKTSEELKKYLKHKINHYDIILDRLRKKINTKSNTISHFKQIRRAYFEILYRINF